MNSVASVKDRLKNKMNETGKTMEQLLVTYGLERTIYRIYTKRRLLKKRSLLLKRVLLKIQSEYPDGILL